MKSLIENGYAFLVRTSVISVRGNYGMTYWGCACPVNNTGPSISITYISERPLSDVVISQSDSLEELEADLLEKAKKRWPQPIDKLNRTLARFGVR